VGNGGGGGPDVAVAGDVATVVEIVENAELAGELGLVWRDVFAIHGEGGSNVRALGVAKDLIVGAVFLDDVNHVMNFVFAGGEGDTIAVTARGVHVHDLFCVGG